MGYPKTRPIAFCYLDALYCIVLRCVWIYQARACMSEFIEPCYQ